MPDHIHVLLELGARLSISQLVSKTKSRIKRTSRGVEWQLNFFEKRLRDPADAEAYAHYIFMNPYCDGLCQLEETWPGWINGQAIRWEFEDRLRVGGLPQREWLDEAHRFSSTLPTGAG